MITNDPNEIKLLKQSGKILATVLHAVAERAKPGVSAAELNKFAEAEIKRMGARPSFKGYGEPPFPAALTVSVNDAVVHGVPYKDLILQAGDIASLDLGVEFQGFYTDMAMTVPVGRIDAESQKLITAATESLEAGLAQIKPGNYTGDIGHAMELVAKKYKVSAVRDLVGHGVGKAVHEDPEVPGFGKPKSGTKLVEGLVIAVEPMVNIGSHRIIFDKDKWTVKTADGMRSAHMEKTIRVTATGYEVITKC
jgi:methionyl aminopeptidase